MGDSKDLTDEAVSMGNSILTALDEHKADPNIAQAALGYAWVSLCQAMNIPRSVFKEMIDGVHALYKEK
jgi:hypothetical protein